MRSGASRARVAFSRCSLPPGWPGARRRRQRSGQQQVSGYEVGHLVNTFFRGDGTTGHITSPEFQITTNHINFLIGGGFHPYPGDAGNPPTSVNLVIDGNVVRTATGQESERLNWTNWNVSEFAGRAARIDIVDENTGGWGHINADHFMFADQPASPRSTAVSVNLLVASSASCVRSPRTS